MFNYICIGIFLLASVKILMARSLDGTSISLFVLGLLMILFRLWTKTNSNTDARDAALEGLGRKKKILIIDDDKGLLKMIRATLLSQGFHVLSSTTGERGLQLARNQRPDLIVLDVLLPGIKGREVCSRLKDDTHTKDIPVIFLTAKDSPDDVRAEMEVGAISHLTKPINPRVLAVEIKKILGA